MALEKGPSSSSQNSPEPRGLPYILSALGVFWLFSKLFAPPEKSIDSIDPNEKSGEKRESRNPLSPLSPQVQPSPTDSEKTCKYSHHKTPWWQVLLEILMVAFTGGAFGAAAYYAHITAQQRDITLNAFRTDERAWVGIEPLKPKLIAPANGKFTAAYGYDLYLRNSGKTVARCVEVRLPRSAEGSSIDFTNHQDWIANWQDNFLMGKFKGAEGIPIVMSSPQTIAPGQIIPIPLNVYGQAPQVFPNGQQNVSSFVGRIDYIDEFSVRHWVKFCMFIAQRDGSLWYCKYGNDEDRNPEIPPAVEPSCPVTQP